MNKFFKTCGKIATFILATSAMTLTACSEGQNTAGGSSEEAEGFIAISHKTIAGVSQKGPFATGSKVVLKETEGKSFSPTGKEFIATIRNNKGEFKIENINLANQYVRLTATGYYEREATNKYSDCEISLNALSDISDRNQVNINILTHLEYERVLRLIKNGKSFTKAKRQAHEELISSLQLEELLDADPESLDITKNGGADKILYELSYVIDVSEYNDFGYNKVLGNKNDRPRYNENPEAFCADTQRYFDYLASEFAKTGKLNEHIIQQIYDYNK